MKRKKKDDSAENWSYKNDYPIEEVWNTDNYLAGIIAARLKAFKALDKHGYCPAFKGIAEWNKAIQKMIDAFELLKHITSFSDEEEKTIEEITDVIREHSIGFTKAMEVLAVIDASNNQKCYMFYRKVEEMKE